MAAGRISQVLHHLAVRGQRHAHGGIHLGGAGLRSRAGRFLRRKPHRQQHRQNPKGSQAQQQLPAVEHHSDLIVLFFLILHDLNSPPCFAFCISSMDGYRQIIRRNA